MNDPLPLHPIDRAPGIPAFPMEFCTTAQRWDTSPQPIAILGLAVKTQTNRANFLARTAPNAEFGAPLWLRHHDSGGK
jgi:hypothetical protein